MLISGQSWLQLFLGTSWILIIVAALFNNLGENLRNTTITVGENLGENLHEIKVSNELIAENILKASQMQVENSQSSNEGIEKIVTGLNGLKNVLRSSSSNIVNELDTSGSDNQNSMRLLTEAIREHFHQIAD